MEPRRETPGIGEAERRDFVRQGRKVLLSLGQRDLARRYCLLAAGASSREELADLLLSMLLARHPG